MTTKRALLSVSNKEGLVPFAKGLVEAGYELVSTGGTKRALEEAGLPVQQVGDITGFPEILGGRVKSLHPLIHGGLLADVDDPAHREQLEENGVTPIQVVCVNLYPFKETISGSSVTWEDAVENIDIGGPAMLRASAKNHKHVTIVVDPADYKAVLAELQMDGTTSLQTRKRLAAKGFRHTAAYDALIAQYFTEAVEETFPEQYTVTFERKQALRYGENPHQAAAFYEMPIAHEATLAKHVQLHGKELSYNNIQDVNAALEIVREFEKPTAVAVKHMNPCGVGTAATVQEAYKKAYEADPISIFGGIVAVNEPVNKELAMELKKIFLEIILAPSFTDEAFEVLTTKKNLRLLTLPVRSQSPKQTKLTSVSGGILQQDENSDLYEGELHIATDREPTADEWRALELGWRVVKHVKSNAIVVSDHEKTLGIGAGQMNRVGAANIALEQAGQKAQGAILASDAFFPMDDTVEAAAKAGITAIIQPGGSIRDAESIAKANEYGIAMVFTGMRHFTH